MGLTVTPPGTRGGELPRVPEPFTGVATRLFFAVFRRFGSRMRIAGRPLLLLTTVGAKSGRERETILGFWDDTTRPGSVLVIASNGGAMRHPGWVHNLAAHPDRVWVERDRRRIQATPEILDGAEREAAWGRTGAQSPEYRGYLEKTDREIPIVRLTPVT